MSGMAWQGTGRFAERGLRFAANLVLARLLAPDDFGAFAALLLPLAIVDSIAYFATGPVIIQSADGDRPRFLRTVLTINMIRGLVLSLVLLALAPLAADYFERPELLLLFLLAAVQPLMTGLESPGVHVLAKNMRFGRIAACRVGAALAGAATSVLMVWFSPSVLALLVGQLAGVAAATMLTWFIAPMRPSIGIDRAAWKVIRSYAGLAAGTPVLIMLVEQAPALFLGRLSSLEPLGVFMMNTRLAEFPVYITLTVAGAVLIPAYSLMQDDRDRLKRAWMKAWAAIGFVSAPAAVLLAWTGDALPVLVWGERYGSVQPLMPILALNGLLSCLLAVTGPLFWGVGRPSIDRLMQLVRVCGVFVVGYLMVGAFGSIGVAWGLTAGLLLALCVAIPFALSIVGASFVPLARATIPALLGAILVAVPLLILDVVLEPETSLRVTLAAGVGSVFLLLVLAASRVPGFTRSPWISGVFGMPDRVAPTMSDEPGVHGDPRP